MDGTGVCCTMRPAWASDAEDGIPPACGATDARHDGDGGRGGDMMRVCDWLTAMRIPTKALPAGCKRIADCHGQGVSAAGKRIPGGVWQDRSRLRLGPPDAGGCSRIRTYDPLIKSQLLYQLSYAPAEQRGAPYNSASGFCKEGADGFLKLSPAGQAGAITVHHLRGCRRVAEHPFPSARRQSGLHRIRSRKEVVFGLRNQARLGGARA